MINAILKLIKASLCMFLAYSTGVSLLSVLLGMPALIYYAYAIKIFISESLSDTVNDEYDREDLKIIFYGLLATSGLVFGFVFVALPCCVILVCKIYITSMSRYLKGIKELKNDTSDTKEVEVN